MALEVQLELVGNIGSRKIDAFITQKLLFHLGEFLLGRIDLSEDQGDLLGDERDVLGSVDMRVILSVVWGVCEGV